jgi:4-hydroxybenzoate polyprenyltransferase
LSRKPRSTQAWKPDLKAVRTGPVPALPTGVDGQTIPGNSKVAAFANFVKLPHTVFALPFALVGVVYASHTNAVTLAQVLLILLAFTSARFAAMGFNRIVDRAWDAKNPRTKDRELPSGALSPKEAGVSVIVASIVFVGAAAALNQICLILSLPTLGWILGYSYSKRFTNWSHLWLGGALAIAPAGGFLAITGAWSTPSWTIPVLSGAVLCWVAGFDMFYALQDHDFDREQGLKSAVVLLGKKRSILLAKSLHGITIVALLVFGYGSGFGLFYYSGIGAASLILAWEHSLVNADDLSRVDPAFFMFNGVISIVVFLGTLADRIF